MTADIEARRAENRATMPRTTAIFDQAVADFGPGCKLLYATENGRTVGKVAHAHRRRGVDAIPGWPADYKHEAFLATLVEEYIKKVHRLPNSGDPAWVAFATAEHDKRLESFKP